MESRTRLAVSLAVCALSLLCLYAYACSVNPMDVRIGDIGTDDVGALVRTHGHVRKAETIGAGGIKIELLDITDFAIVPVYLPAKVARSIEFLTEIVPGSRVSVTGEVQEFNGQVEISVSDASMVGLLAGARENRIALDALAENAATFDGMGVTVRGAIGELEAIVDYDKVMIHAGGDFFWVEDAGRHWMSGEVDVLGRLLYDEGRNRFEIKVAGNNDTIGLHPITIPESYAVVSLQTLAGAAQDWDGRLLAVLNVEMIVGEVIGTSFTLSDAGEDGTSHISCIIFGWSWSADDRGIVEDIVVDFSGTWGYYEHEARWQITSDEFTLAPWI